MRQYQFIFKTKTISWAVLLLVSLVLYGCSDPADTAGAQCTPRNVAPGINMANYLPNCTQSLCTYASEFTYGKAPDGAFRRLVDNEREKFITKKESTERVPYSSGELLGSRYVTRRSNAGNTDVTITSSMRSDGSTLKFLEYGGTKGTGYWYASDCALSSHPAVWSIGEIIDGEIRNQDTQYYRVGRRFTSNSATCLGPYNQIILTKIVDVTLGNGITYNNAVIFYYLHRNLNTFVDLNMSNIDMDLGITLPTSAETNSRAVESIDIYAPKIGWIAGGLFSDDPATGPPLGSLHHFGEFTAEVCL